ncbi:protein tyrosine phosphatase [Rhizobium bangladeshense]|uniref:Protein tyrosine phosphatase n=1 Tax=Rhizobium bangladeshense TaxID=1138189 RepID=A0ABS7LM99_9HYPH|nr:protein tyrosine phosphatase [Rhizobium bangladeshense]MBX4867688.1 protein tyrosine phosphatase [Rhizobium bangladeshense]MBX4871981.1 protein tyrosine phosphatase [Rhizobium bangladeshense]MBX4883294.1 protein tyrosine phosphatase [Rhizobium bangladeshense]MBX4892114.1 protein tyrosine phosphatase [Rhizobium bangladeshense]MBX4923207.1 protein tyrosine phosphatase [Rhizobium bangladeshense]
MQDGIYRVLFLSRRNSARSVMAEAILNKIGKGRFKAFSAAVDPAPVIEPTVLQLLRNEDYPIEDIKPRHFRDFADAGATDLDFVFTLSDTAAGEALPEWPGLPITGHWRCPDPILVEDEAWQRKQAFMQVLTGLERRLNIFINLPFASLDRMSLQHHIRDIGDAEKA